jgi:Mg2+ and Co2+ transporter CorA
MTLLLPRTLITSMCGMNAECVLELNHQAGYPFAIGQTLASALAPMWCFMKLGLSK